MSEISSFDAKYCFPLPGLGIGINNLSSGVETSDSISWSVPFLSKHLVVNCNNRYNHVIRHCINTRPCCHNPISHNHVTLPAHIPEPVQSLTCAQSWFTVLHSCGALCQTHVLAYVHSLPHGNMITPLFPCTFSTLILRLHASPSLYVTLCMPYAHIPCRTPISPDNITSSDLTCRSI